MPGKGVRKLIVNIVSSKTMRIMGKKKCSGGVEVVVNGEGLK